MPKLGEKTKTRTINQKKKKWQWHIDNVVVDAIKLALLNYSNFSIVELVVNKLDRVKLSRSHLPTNTKLILNIW